VIVGVYVVSNVWKEPHYDVMLAWDPEAIVSAFRHSGAVSFVSSSTERGW
jgi:hypothetical protein